MMFWYILIASIFGGLRPENHLAFLGHRGKPALARESRLEIHWECPAGDVPWPSKKLPFDTSCNHVIYIYVCIYRLIMFDSQMTQITIWLFIRHAATGEVRWGFKTWRLLSPKRKPREDGMRFRTGLQGFDGHDIAMTSPNKMGVC